MFKFGQRSNERLEGVDGRLIFLLSDALAVSPIDFGIPANGGKRTTEEQYYLFCENLSKCDGREIKSNHQVKEGALYSRAADVYAILNGKASWDRDLYFMFAGIVLGLAKKRGLKIRWGGDWNGDFNFKDQSFNDLCHFELLD